MDPILTPILVTGLIGAGFTAAAAAAVAPFIGGLILFAGATYLRELLAPKPPKPDDGKVAIQQPIPPTIYAAGQVRLAGAVTCNEAANGNFYYAVALTRHRIESIERYFLHDDEVTLDGSGAVNDTFADERYRGDVTLLTRLGVVPETPFAEFVSGLGGDIWDSDHRGDGCAQLGMICNGIKSANFSARYPNGKPIPSAVIKGALLYDPRDVAQDPDDDTTWEYSTNIVLQILWHQCFCEAGPRRNYAAAVLPVVDQWIACADICDENVALFGGGTQERYHGGGWFTSENDPKAVLALMLAACDGWFVERGDGTIWLEVGKLPDEADVAVITDDDIAGFFFQTDIADEEAVNRWVLKFNSPPHLYTEVECDPWDDEDDQVARGRIREQSLDLSWVQSYQMARRVGKRERFRQKQKLRGYLDLKLSAINAMYKRWIRIESVLIPRLGDTLVENRGARFTLAAGGIRLEFIGTGEGIEDWTATLADEGIAPPVPDRPESLGPPVPTNVVAYADDFQIQTGTMAIRLIVTFDALARTDLDFVVRWRTQDINPGAIGNQPGPWNEEIHREELTPNNGRLEITTGIVEGDAVLEVEVASLGRLRSPWSVTAIVDTGVIVDTLVVATGSRLKVNVFGDVLRV